MESELLLKAWRTQMSNAALDIGGYINQVFTSLNFSMVLQNHKCYSDNFISTIVPFLHYFITVLYHVSYTGSWKRISASAMICSFVNYKLLKEKRHGKCKTMPLNFPYKYHIHCVCCHSTLWYFTGNLKITFIVNTNLIFIFRIFINCCMVPRYQFYRQGICEQGQMQIFGFPIAFSLDFRTFTILRFKKIRFCAFL